MSPNLKAIPAIDAGIVESAMILAPAGLPEKGDLPVKRSRLRHHGLRKRCRCRRKDWPKCAHAWHLNYQPRGGTHYRVSLDRVLGRHVDSKSEAEIEARNIRTAIDAGTFRPKPYSGEPTATPEPVETLERYARTWLRTAALNLKASTVRFYTDNIENHVVPVVGAVPIGAVSRKHCRELVTAAREKGLKVATVRGIARTLSVVLSQAVEDEHLAANPALKLGKYLRRGDEPKPHIDPLTRAEAMHLLNVAHDHVPEWHPWLLTALRTGLRLGELLALQWGDIDWHGGFIQVQRNLVGGKLTTPKNHQCRRVDLSRQLRATLRLWRRRKSAEWLKLGRPRPTWVFSSVVGTPFDESNVRKAYGRILEQAELRHRRIHDLRHTFASLLIQQGESLVYVKEQMGHASIQITVDIYGHLVPGGNRAAVDRLDDPRESVAQPLHTPAPTASQALSLTA
jgi:integrase